MAPPQGPPYLSPEFVMDPHWDVKCGLNFGSLEERSQHIWSSSQHIVCGICMGRSMESTKLPQEFDNLNLRLEHYLNAHFACKVCSSSERIKTFRNQKALQDHMYHQHCACPCCETPRLFDDLMDRRVHIQNYHKACLICSSESIILAFENVAGLLSHLEDIHHGCIFECGSPVFRNNKALRQHYVDKHFGCSFCTIRSLQDEKQRENHYDNEHHGLRGNHSSSRSGGHASFRCKECNDNTGFSQSEELASHMRMCHGAINCPDPNCTHPRLIFYQPFQRAHMETCHHPNPCNDFDTKTAMDLKNCYMCNFPFWAPNIVLQHYHNCHPCKECEGYIGFYFSLKNTHVYLCHGEGRFEHLPFERPHWKTSTPCPEQRRPPPPPGPIDVYAILHIYPQCSDEEAKRAARQRRIDTHPDKLKREGMSKAETDAIDEMAKMVGFAADIVTDSAKRLAHDKEMWRWRVKHRQC